MSPEPSYTLSHAARLLGVSPDTVRRWADADRFPTTTGTSSRRRVAGADLAAFAQSLAAEPETGRTSARNAFPGLVTRVQMDGVAAQVDIQAGPHRVVSLMTREAVEELKLAPGVEVVALVKAPAVVVQLP
ncbi:MAG: TOBE domain-containing protein [Actinomycetia bacterium]|nr:TOBE domain-containing protein [Actinomycetes bacterium]